jgi:hypothetical protein
VTTESQVVPSVAYAARGYAATTVRVREGLVSSGRIGEAKRWTAIVMVCCPRSCVPVYARGTRKCGDMTRWRGTVDPGVESERGSYEAAALSVSRAGKSR